MSDPSVPLRQWPAGIPQASPPANENALRLEAFLRPCLGVANDETGTDADGDTYIVGDTPVNAFASFTENDIALARVDSDGTSWHAWAPFTGARLVVAGERKVYDGAAWIDDPSIIGGAVAAEDVSYDNTTSGLAATDAQAAIDEVASDIGSLTGAVIDVETPANSSGTVTLDFAGLSRYVGAITLTANVSTLAFSNLPGAGHFAEYELHISQDGTGSRTFAVPASHRALGGSDLVIASTPNAVTVLTASTVDNATTWRYAMQESA